MPKIAKHGHSFRGKVTRTYRIWALMKKRCLSPSTEKDLRNYSARGIFLCERWKKFSNFLEDMGEAPDGKSIDRINNDSGYEKSNCRWASHIEQGNNRRDNRLLTAFGKTQTASSWAREAGLAPRTFLARLYLGWTIERAITEKKHLTR